jgi:hypothetical protein
MVTPGQIPNFLGESIMFGKTPTLPLDTIGM